MAKRLLPVWTYPLVAVFVWAAALVLFLYFFGPLKMILLGLLATVAVAAMLKPIVDRIPGPRGLAAVGVGSGFIAFIAGLIALLSWLVAKPIDAEIKDWDQTRQTLNNLLQKWSRRFGLTEPVDVETLARQVGVFFIGDGGQAISATTNVAFDFLIILAFIFIGSIYLLAEPQDRLLNEAAKLLPPRRRPALKNMIGDLEPKLRWWLIGVSISMSIVGAASWLGYTIIGLKFAIPLALLAGMSEIIPTVGPAVAFLVAILFAATQSTGQVIGVIIVYAIIQLLESYIILPLVMRKAVKIPPIITLFTVVLWGKIFGAAGLLLAIPINLALWSAAQHFIIHPPHEKSSLAKNEHE